MQDRQINKPLSLNTDKHHKYLSETEAFFLLNHERNLNGLSTGGTLGKTTPHNANFKACEMVKPAGENYAPNKYHCKTTKETYSWVYNSNGVHYLQRINSDGLCEVVYGGDYLPLSADPKHSIEQWRAFLAVDKRQCFNIDGKQLIWCDGLNPIGQIDTEASIATNYFTTPFFDISPDRTAPLRMCVPDPCDCIKGDFIPLTDLDSGKTNHLLDVGLQFSFRHVYYDNRASIWADPSQMFYQDSRGCFNSETGLPRCLELTIPIGNPLVDRIEIAFKKNGTWYLYDTVEKYKKYNSVQEKWYQRQLSEDVASTLDSNNWTFKYTFCGDKQCVAIAPDEFNRVFNPMPIAPQGLFNVEDALAFYNYIQGVCSFDKTEAKKFRITPNCIQEKCQIEYVKIKVRAIIYNQAHPGNQFIYRFGKVNGSEDDPSDTAYFGGLNNNGIGTQPDLESGYDQFFSEKTRNFIVYIEGTDYWAEMKQHKAHPLFTNREIWGTVYNMDDPAERRRWRRAIRNGEFFYQEAEIRVPKGTRGFLRLASHRATGNEQNTSTFVLGVLPDIRTYSGIQNITSSIDYSTEEIYFDTCDGLDKEIYSPFVIDDNAVDDGGSNKAASFYGYITDKNNLPVEGAEVSGSFGGLCRTDHNGFWHLYDFPGANESKSIYVKVEQDCFSFSTIETASVEGEKGYATRHDIQIQSETYRDGFKLKVKMFVKDCNGVGVSGVRVAISGSKYKTSGVSGLVEFFIRNYSTRDRQVRAVVMNNKGCFIADCGSDCNPCMPTKTSSTISCYYSSTSVVNLQDAIVNTGNSMFVRNGLKKGGAYLYGFVLKGDCGRISQANEVGRLDIPRLQENPLVGFCSFDYNATGMKFPSWANCLHIVRSENLNPFELQWVVDSVERTTDGKIKLTIQSLNDYNEKYFFKTNSVYKWLAGDRVEFIRNGDGNVFNIATNGLLNYLTISPFLDENIIGENEPAADFFNQLLIEDDGRLSSLKEGAIIELQRQKECTTEPAYFGICASIPIVNGELLYPTGNFRTFDTYLVNRQIGNNAAQVFEHHSPSDFWGERLTDVGKPYFVNKYESERRYGRNITLNNPNEFNRFGDFVKTLNPITHDDIIAIGVSDEKIGLCISQSDNSLFEVGADLLKVGGDGIVRAISPEEIISDTQPKLAGRYGCQYEDIGSVYFGDNYATWADTSNGFYIKHNYQQAKAVDEGKFNSFFRRKYGVMKQTNAAATNDLDKMRFATGYNPVNKAVILTMKSLRHSGINNEKGYFKKPNETVLFHPDSEEFLTMMSYTAEGYAELQLNTEEGCAFLAFLNGIPYIHPKISDRFNEFFDVPVDRVIGVSINKSPEKLKIGVSYEIEDDSMWYVSDVTTDDPNFSSEIPPIRVSKYLRRWNGSFLGNKNSRAGLFNGDKPRGYHISVTFVRDNTDSLKYNSIDNNKRIKYDELDLILFKFSMSEQSGFENNL